MEAWRSRTDQGASVRQPIIPPPEPGPVVASDTVWRIRLLQSVEVTGPCGPLVLTSRKAAALVAYVAVQPHASASRDALVQLLWEDVDPAQGRASLRQALASIRRLDDAASPLITADANTVRMGPSVRVDARDFSAFAREPGLRSRAAELYGADLMAGFALRGAPAFHEWLIIEQARFRQMAVSVFSDLIDASLAQGGDLHLGLEAALRLVAVDPLNEIGHRGLMTIYARQGRSCLAIQQFRGLTRLLREELQVAPEPATSDLYHALQSRRRQPARAARFPAAGGMERPVNDVDPHGSQAAVLRGPGRLGLTHKLIIGIGLLVILLLGANLAISIADHHTRDSSAAVGTLRADGEHTRPGSSRSNDASTSATGHKTWRRVVTRRQVAS